MKTQVETPFPVGAWVRDTFATNAGGGIIRNAGFATKYHPTAGEIVSIGLVMKRPHYRLKFADREVLAPADQCVCYQCGATGDDAHLEGCIDKTLRAIPHEPGYAA